MFFLSLILQDVSLYMLMGDTVFFDYLIIESKFLSSFEPKVEVPGSFRAAS